MNGCSINQGIAFLNCAEGCAKKKIASLSARVLWLLREWVYKTVWRLVAGFTHMFHGFFGMFCCFTRMVHFRMFDCFF